MSSSKLLFAIKLKNSKIFRYIKYGGLQIQIFSSDYSSQFLLRNDIVFLVTILAPSSDPGLRFSAGTGQIVMLYIEVLKARECLPQR